MNIKDGCILLNVGELDQLSELEKELIQFILFSDEMNSQAQYHAKLAYHLPQVFAMLPDVKKFVFANRLVRRLCGSNPHVVHWDVYAEELFSDGGFSCVYRVLAKISLKDNKLVIQRRNDLLAKQLFLSRHNAHEKHMVNLNEVRQERELALEYGLRVRKPVVFISHVFLPMKMVSGLDLFKVIRDDFAFKRILTLQQRLSISIQLLRELQYLHDLNILHRDLNYKNIKVDLEGNKPKVKIIDFGIAVKMHKRAKIPRLNNHDTLFYPAVRKEFKYGTMRKQSEYYTVGILLGLIWRSKSIFLEKHLTKDGQIDFKLLEDDLFYGLNELDSNQQSLIKASIKGMLHDDPDNRINYQEACDCFEKIELDHAHFAYSKETQDSYRMAASMGVRARRYLGELLSQPVQDGVTQSKATEVALQVMGYLFLVSADRRAVQVFVDRSGLGLLEGSQTKEEVRARLDRCIVTYFGHFARLNELKAWANALLGGNDELHVTASASEMLRSIVHIRSSMGLSHVNFNQMHHDGLKVLKRLNMIEERLTKLELMVNLESESDKKQTSNKICALM